MKQFMVADLFCGAGGSSTGAERAIREIGGEMVLVAVNHWPLAIETHQKNHPSARHYVEDVTAVDPERIVPEGRLDLLMASPECRYFSRARGAKPVSDQGRMNPWAVQRWLTALDVRCVLIENVPEFVEWGPLTDGDRPDPERKGLYFEGWVRSLWELGYAAEWRMLNAADFGDATTRVRFFLQARKDGRPIHWPEPTHSATGGDDLFGGRPRWRSAREIIEWDNPGRSLLDDPRYHRKPLSEKTRRRIARGLEKFGGPLAPLYINLLGLDTPLPEGEGEGEPFISTQRNHNAPRSVDNPIPTVTTLTGGGVYLVEPTAEPFILGQQSGAAPRGTAEPIPTVAGAGAISLVEPVMACYYGTSDAASVDRPVPTVTTKARFGLATPTAEPFILNRHGDNGGERAHDIGQPLPTVTTRGAGYLVDPFIVPQWGERDGQAPRVHAIADPLPAVTSHGAGALVDPVVLQVSHGVGDSGRLRSVDEPLWTVTSQRNVGVAEPMLRQAEDADIDPRRLILINGALHVLDIRFRMLTNTELARAMGFDDEESRYEFVGTIGQVTRQIGNAVPVGTAAALVRAILGPKVAEQPEREAVFAAAD